MSDNIVIFGPTHSGKSTLMGYLMVYNWKEETYIQKNQQIRSKMEENGLRYNEDMILAYYVDIGDDERRSNNEKEKLPGTSKRNHIKQTALDLELNCTFIDTPGSDIAWKHKYEGLFLGDIGIFMIEIDKLTELSGNVVGSNTYNAKVNELFWPIYLWKHYKRMKRLLIVISKIDMASYSAYSIKRAISTLQTIDVLKEVPIIPISIDVRNRKGCNIIDSVCDEMKWYKGKSLIDEVKDMLQKEHREEKEETVTIACIERLIPKTKSSNQSAIRVKVLNGAIHIKDEVYFGPVKFNKNNVILKGMVSSLKHESRGLVEELSKGEIGGIIFSKLWTVSDKEILKLTEIELKRTSMIYQEVKDCRKGNLLYFSISKKELNKNLKDYFQHCIIGNRLKMIWFGKIISMHLLNIIDDGEKYNIVLMNTSSQESLFMLPMKKNGRLLYEQFVLQVNELFFINAYLRDLEMVSENLKREVIFTFEGQIKDKKNLFDIGSAYKNNYDTEKNQTTISWEELTEQSLKRVMDIIGKFLRSEKIENYKTNILPQKKNL